MAIHRSSRPFVLLLGLLSAALADGQVTQHSSVTSIAIIGVQHAPGQFIAESMSPGHVRGCLEALQPEVVCIENTPERFAHGHHCRATYEAQGVAVPWARARKVPVHAVDWIGDNSGHWGERRRVQAVRTEEKVRRQAKVDPRYYDFGAADARHFSTPRHCPDFRHLNGKAYADERIRWLDSGKTRPGSAQAYIAVRDSHITDRIATASRANAGKRLAVVIGASHKANLERRLAGLGFEILPLPSSVSRNADTHLVATDAAAILTTSLDTGLFRVPPERKSRLLEVLGSSSELSAQIRHRYIQARFLMIQGKREEAVNHFRALATPETATPFPHPGTHWRLHLTVEQASRLELGRIADLEGKREEAVAHYRKLLETIKVPPADSAYESDFLFLARAHNAVRGLLSQPYQLDLDRKHRPGFAASGAAAGVSSDLKKALALYRKREWAELERLATAMVKNSSSSRCERYEALFHLASARAARRRFDTASRALAELDRIRKSMPPGYWVNKLLPALRERIRERAAR